jgi:hypothetical protein
MNALPWPASPHDPSERELVERLGTWEVRVFGLADARHAYLLRRGMGHLQLWHPREGVSLLTPSLFTRSRWELDVPGPARQRLRLDAVDDVDDILCSRRLPLTPDVAALRCACERHVLRALRELLLLGGFGAPGQPIPCA